MDPIYNGMPAAELGSEGWHKPWSGGNGGNCIEAMKLADGRVAVRQSSDPDGPALDLHDRRDRRVHSRREIGTGGLSADLIGPGLNPAVADRREPMSCSTDLARTPRTHGAYMTGHVGIEARTN